MLYSQQVTAALLLVRLTFTLNSEEPLGHHRQTKRFKTGVRLQRHSKISYFFIMNNCIHRGHEWYYL